MSELESVEKPVTKKSEKILRDIVAIFISACALGVSLYAVYIQQDTAKRSNKPYMFVNYYYDDSGSGFRLSNSGVGSAYLHWFQILVDGQPQASWAEMYTLLGLEKGGKYEYSRPTAVFRSGSQNIIFWVRTGAADQQLRQSGSRVSFKMCYCSIFDDCWLSTSIHAPQEQKSCDPPPKIRYGGLPDPATPW